jgi:hypothetical protein
MSEEKEQRENCSFFIVKGEKNVQFLICEPVNMPSHPIDS